MTPAYALSGRLVRDECTAAVSRLSVRCAPTSSPKMQPGGGRDRQNL